MHLFDADVDVLERARTRLLEAMRDADLDGGADIVARPCDVADEADVGRALQDISVALSAVPYRFAPSLARAAVEAGCSLVDLGGNTAISRRLLDLHDAAAAAGVTLVPDTGLAPGLANTLAAAGIARMDSPRAVRIFCGGLPQEAVPPLGYKLVFNIEGLLNEYSGRAVYLREGRRVEVEALSEVVEIDLPRIGRVEAFPTSGGTSTAPETFVGRLETYEYHTVRYLGHRDRFLMLADLGLLDESPIEIAPNDTVRPRDLLIRLLTPLLEHPGVEDLVVLRVDVEGEHERERRRIRFDLYDEQDASTGYSAMERCTAHPAAIVAEMIVGGEVEPGARPLEIAVPSERYLEHLRRRPLDIRETCS